MEAKGHAGPVVNEGYNPLIRKSDQFQISPPATPKSWENVRFELMGVKGLKYLQAS